MIHAQWVGVDWGTSHLRAWAMDGSGTVLATRHSGDGMGGLESGAFEGALLKLIGDWLAEDRATDVVACGMVGARQGWMEAPYRAVPCTPAGADVLEVRGTDPRLRMFILPGLMQADPPDAMRGEETQIAGYIAQEPDFSGYICLPGTHSKWVRVEDGEVIAFSTYMTGELFALFSRHSVLRHTVAPDGWDDDGFAEALKATCDKPERAAGEFFGLRAAALLHGLAPQTARARLSGIVLGMELAAALPFWKDDDIVIIGASGLGQRYAEALKILGGRATLADGDAMTLAGLVSAYRQLQGDKA